MLTYSSIPSRTSANSGSHGGTTRVPKRTGIDFCIFFNLHTIFNAMFLFKGLTLHKILRISYVRVEPIGVHEVE